jgi:exosome complex RNA-binding protein Csl4
MARVPQVTKDCFTPNRGRRVIGRVVRLLPNGIAIGFVELQNSRALERMSVRVDQTGSAANSDSSEPAACGDAISA